MGRLLLAHHITRPIDSKIIFLLKSNALYEVMPLINANNINNLNYILGLFLIVIEKLIK